MRDTLITLAGALISFFVLVSIMTPQQEQQQLSQPTTEDAGKHGLKALHNWLKHNNVSTHSLRKPVTRIAQDQLPRTGNLMVVSLPYAREALDTEWAALNQWIERGNTVLVLASLYHKPAWSGDGFASTVISKITNKEFSLYKESLESAPSELDLDDIQRSIESFKPAEIELHASIDHPLFTNSMRVRSWHTPGLYQFRDELDEIQNAYYYIDSESSRLAMQLMQGDSDEHVAMWLLPVGKGWVYLSAFPDLVSNSVLKENDNAQWFANLASLTVSGDGRVIFDDYHFGLSDLYDPDAFFSDQRLHNTFLFIGAFWLIYAFGRSPRLAPVRNQIIRPATRDFIEATAGFFTRRIKPRIIARELAVRTVDDLSHQTQLHGEALWSWLQDHPGVMPQDINVLQRASGYIKGRAKLFKLTRSINRIHKVLR